MSEKRKSVDVAVVGAGAAGLMAAVHAGTAARARGTQLAIVALDSASRIGAKILIAGGGRCNVTHDAVDETAFAGSTPAAIRKVLLRFGVEDTIQFFASRGVALKREPGGKLFPTTDRARTVLDALLGAARAAGVELVHPWRVEDVTPVKEGFMLRGPHGEILARRVILTTGGRSLPKSGSDGHGLEIARRLGHSTTARILPGLVPLLLADACFLRRLSGLTVDAALTLRAESGKSLRVVRGSLLCTHFGISGPAVLDISRHWLHARCDDPGARLTLNWLPELGATEVQAELAQRGGHPVGAWLRARLPARLADALGAEAEIDRNFSFDRLSRDARRGLVDTICAYSASRDRRSRFYLRRSHRRRRAAQGD